MGNLALEPAREAAEVVVSYCVVLLAGNVFISFRAIPFDFHIPPLATGFFYLMSFHFREDTTNIDCMAAFHRFTVNVEDFPTPGESDVSDGDCFSHHRTPPPEYILHACA